MKKYLIGIVLVGAQQAVGVEPQKLAKELFDAIDTLEKELPQATQEPTVISGKIELTKRDAKNRFDRAIVSVRTALAQNPELLVQLGAIQKNGESLIDRALRFEKTNAAFSSKGVIMRPLSDMFYVLQRIMTTVIPDKTVYASILQHAGDIAASRDIDAKELTNILRPVLSGLDALQSYWLKASPAVTEKIFKYTSNFKDLLLHKDGTSIEAQDVAQALLGDLFARDDSNAAAIIFPWALEALGVNKIPWQKLSGEKIKNFLAQENITIPTFVVDKEYGGGVPNALAAVIVRSYAQRQEARRIHGFKDDPLIEERYRAFVLSFLKDPSQELKPLVDGKGNFINPLVYAIQVEDADLLKAMLKKNPRLGAFGAEGTYISKNGELSFKRSKDLYSFAKTPQFVSVMAEAGVKLPDSTALPVLPKDSVQERILAERAPQALRQLSEALFALSYV